MSVDDLIAIIDGLKKERDQLRNDIANARRKENETCARLIELIGYDWRDRGEENF